MTPARASNGAATVATYVKTTEIRTAIKDRETQVLDALAIPWRDGRPHITCPYRDHHDEDPSWRWDHKASKARCTCSNGDDIFDVLMRIEQLDFDAAKVRAAELIGRTDLIRTNGQHQATDAASLLNAPRDNRDDSLPVAYLAHRLGVDARAVPIPSTPVVGLKALGYYDAPPPGSKAKPKLVGEFPCAVFGTVAADGRTHAHRIYVAPGGAGKADLGARPDGQPRDPKKSARIIGDDNTSGRSVLWGDPERAPWIILCEGIETGAAVAFAFQSEIETGEAVVASAISAGGVEAFRPYPGTARVTVAADRDEAPKPNGKPGSRRGEQAAREFALRHHRDSLSVAIALPGKPGESLDWLDVLERDGVAAVREGILAAIPFSPTEAERDEIIRRRSLEAELQEVAATYPLPAMDSKKLVYRRTASGKVKIHKLVAGADGPEYVPIATPFGVAGRLRYIDQADAYGLRCMVQDMSGRPRAVDFDRATLAKIGAAEVRAALFAAGLRTENDGEIVAVQCLKAADPQREIIIVRRPGWHEVPGAPDPIFVCPDGSVIGAPEGLDIELSVASRIPVELAAGGSLDGWKRATETAVSVDGCPHWIIGVIAAFAGPVVALTGLDTCGINSRGCRRQARARRSASLLPPGRRRLLIRRACSSRPGRLTTPSKRWRRGLPAPSCAWTNSRMSRARWPRE